MSTEAKEVIAPKINRGAVNAIASAVAKGLATVNGTGSLLHSVCNIARQQYKGKAIPKPDVEAVLAELAESQNWKGRAADIRKSEYRSVLGSYAQLPEAMKAFTDKMARCSWHDGIALSRLLRTKAPKAAASAHASRGKKSAKGKDPATLARSDAKANIAKAVKRILKMAKVEKDFRDALRELCASHSIKV